MKRYIKSAFEFPKMNYEKNLEEKRLDDMVMTWYDNYGFDETVARLSELSDDELVRLWHLCLFEDWGKAYDDEVYEAIWDRPNSEELFALARRYRPWEADIVSRRAIANFLNGFVSADETVENISEILHTTDL